jgi:hypothetical protein
MNLGPIIVAIIPLLVAVVACCMKYFSAKSNRLTGAVGLIIVMATWWSGYQTMHLKQSFTDEWKRGKLCQFLIELTIEDDVKTKQIIKHALLQKPRMSEAELWDIISKNQ